MQNEYLTSYIGVHYRRLHEPGSPPIQHGEYVGRYFRFHKGLHIGTFAIATVQKDGLDRLIELWNKLGEKDSFTYQKEI